MRKTILSIASAKASTPLVCLTAYTAPMAARLDAQCDILLVGDSVAMVLYGHPSTLQADMDMMIRHGQAVMRSTQNALVVVDMPFGSYQESKQAAFRNAATILRETGAGAVKMEGGAELAETVAFLSSRGIPVMGHIGLQPQSVNTLGGYKAQGRDEDTAAKIRGDASAIANAGAFAIVIEGVAESLAASITRSIPCPTIGIGASSACDGQILVTEDMLGITQGKKPKFVKEYAAMGGDIEAAVLMYAQEVRARRFPESAYTYAQTKTEPPKSEATVPQQINTVPIARPQLELEPVSPIAAPTPQKTTLSTPSEFVLRAMPRRNQD